MQHTFGKMHNTIACINAMKLNVLRALEIIGGQAETYAKGLSEPIKTGALHNSITHRVLAYAAKCPDSFFGP